MSKRPSWEEEEENRNILKEQRLNCFEALKFKMDKKAEMNKLQRRMQMEQGEKEMEENIEKEKNNARSCQEKHENEKKLAAEMSRLRREEESKEKTREQLRESSEELKIVESKLRAAYVRKQLTAQMAEKEARAAQEKLEKIKIQEMMENEAKCMKEQARLKEDSYLANKIMYRDELLKQIKEGNKKVRDAERDLILEKALLEQAMRKLREEDERDKQARLDKLKQVKEEIDDFQRQKEIRKKNEKIAREEEERRVREYAEEKERQEEKRKNDLKEIEAKKNKVRDNMTSVHLNKLQQIKEREDILALLAEEEIRQRDLKKDKEKEEAAHKLKEEFSIAYKQHIEEKNVAWKVDFEEQERYRHEQSEIIAKQDKLDKSSAGNKEVRCKELRDALLQQMKDKHRRQVEDWQRASALGKLSEVEEKERMRIVEEERLRMLRNHAPKLIGYLPRGVLHENDLKCLGSEFLEKLCKYNSMNS